MFVSGYISAIFTSKLVPDSRASAKFHISKTITSGYRVLDFN